jgi:glycosyltransferase involved in cell wall biosynthesis
VLGFRCGSVPEIIDDHVTGRVVATVDEAIATLSEVIRLDRRAVRRRFLERFSAPRMAADYLNVYQGVNRSAEPGAVHINPPLERNLIPRPKHNPAERHAN